MTAYEESIKVPLILTGPGVPAGQIREQMVLNTDLAPTIAQLAGVSPPEFVDGRSLIPLLGSDAEGTRWRQGLLVEHEGGRNPSNTNVPPGFRALRTIDSLYVEYFTGERELYDMIDDPYQLESLYNTAEGSIIDGLAAWLGELKSCVGAACRSAEIRPP